MIEFREIVKEDASEYKRHVLQTDYMACEFAFCSLYLWRAYYQSRICFKNGMFYLATIEKDGRYVYRFPIGSGDLREAMDEINRDAKERNQPVVYYGLTEAMRELFEEAAPGKFDYKQNRDAADYIYNTNSLAELSGKKLHAKRNFINRFRALYEGRYAFEPVSEQNTEEIRAFSRDWNRKRQDGKTRGLEDEEKIIDETLREFNRFCLRGAVLRLDGRIIAFTLGSELSPKVFVIHFEKADDTVPGAYNMINYGFVNVWLKEYAYINREEDLGIEGLRRAKMSYQPEIILMRYTACMK